MSVLTEVYGAGVLTIATIIVVGLILIVYYSLGLLFLTLFIFLLYMFVVRSADLQLRFRSYD